MLITVAAVGKLKAGPERELCERFLKRAEATGRSLGLTFAVREFSESRAGSDVLRKTQEAATLRAAVPSGAATIALDERARSITSREFADRLAAWRDSGQEGVAFVIGGPDGLSPELLAEAKLKIGLGAMTWPHQLVRIMLAEQLYRAVTILSGHPYHRE